MMKTPILLLFESHEFYRRLDLQYMVVTVYLVEIKETKIILSYEKNFNPY
jgi:hypothetical protein